MKIPPVRAANTERSLGQDVKKCCGGPRAKRKDKRTKEEKMHFCLKVVKCNYLAYKMILTSQSYKFSVSEH